MVNQIKDNQIKSILRCVRNNMEACCLCNSISFVKHENKEITTIYYQQL